MTPHDLLAAFETLAEAPNGIARLRELVLQLAVRGKLVPQDPNDEPACLLLERIAAEKARLVKEGKIPKSKPLPPVSEDEVPFEVPEGWVWTCTAALGIVNPRNETDETTIVGFVPMPLISIDYREPVRPELRPWGDIRKGYTHFADGDIAVAKITPCFQNRKSCVMERLPGGIGAGTTELHVLRPISGTIHPNYLLIFYKSPEFVDGGVAMMTGTAGQQRVPSDYFAFRPVPLPPLPEQHRIVAKVDVLMALLDHLEAVQGERETTRAALRDATLAVLRDAPDAEAVEDAWTLIAERMDDLFTAPTDVAPLRQTIIQLAIRGKLVPQDPNDEPACLLLERIAVEKARRAKEGRIRRENPLQPVDENEVPFEVPARWVYVRIDEVCDIVSGVTKGRKLDGRETVTFPYLRVANVQADHLDLSVIKEIELPLNELEQYRLIPGDVLLTEGGDWDKLGRSAIWAGEIDNCIHQNHIFRARPLDSGLLSQWVSMFTNSPDGRAYFQSCSKQTTNLASINKTQLRGCPLPLPPSAEQHCIVAKVDALMALCDALEANLAATREAQAAFAAAAVHHLDV